MFYGFHGGGAGIAIFIAFIVVRMFMRGGFGGYGGRRRGGWNNRPRDRKDPPDDKPPLDM
ncbi:MAG TPA: hypothetical protein VLW05_03050 [Gaiellaceae bacterium]|jgi:hypothetical protein|nr:hypothetical protein [Gaiellaceae bacterium]